MPSLQAGIFGSRLRGRGLPLLRADQLQGCQHRAPPEATASTKATATASGTTAADVRCHRRERRSSLTSLFPISFPFVGDLLFSFSFLSFFSATHRDLYLLPFPDS